MPNIITHTLFAQEIFDKVVKTRMIYLNLDFTYWKLVQEWPGLFILSWYESKRFF